MKDRQYRSRQGRSDRDYEQTSQFAFYAMTAGLVLFIIYSIITNA